MKSSLLIPRYVIAFDMAVASKYFMSLTKPFLNMAPYQFMQQTINYICLSKF